MCDPIRREILFSNFAREKEDQSTIKMPEDNKTEGDPRANPFNPANIIHPTTIDQLSEELTLQGGGGGKCC